jgi:hypothetical protein
MRPTDSAISNTWNLEGISADILSYLREEATDSVKYYGVSYKAFCPESEASWLIWRETRLSTGIYRRDYAAGSQGFNKKWTERTTYFESTPESAFQNTYSLQFDGVNDYLSAFLPVLDQESNVPFSIAMWVNPVNIDANVRSLFSNFTNKGKFVFVQNGRVAFYLLSSGSAGLAITSGIVLSPGVWSHIVVTYDGSSLITGLKIYAGGILNASTTTINTLSGTIVGGNIAQIGAQTAVGTRYYPGKLDEIAIYNKALSAAEVLQLYNGGAAVNCNILPTKTNLVHWYRMGDGDIFPTFADLGFAGPNVNLTAVNMIASSIVEDTP